MNLRTRAVRVSFTAVVCLFLSCPLASPEPLYRPKKELRSVTTEIYEILIQKNGAIAVNLSSGMPIFSNVFPMIWYDGEDEPRLLPVDGKFSSRIEVLDRLGEGQGIALKKDSCEWMIRAYPSKPFLAAQVSFTNMSKKPVAVKMLMPWCVGAPKKGGFSLGPNTATSAYLTNGSVFTTNEDEAQLTEGACLSQWNVAGFNAQTGRSLIAGFLTNKHGYTQIRIEPNADSKTPDMPQFRGECVYDPPLVIAPGQRLESEVLYLGVNETSPLAGLERYGHAYATVNEISRTHPFLPHGWDSWSTQYHKAINEDLILKELNAADRELKRYGWTHFAIDDGWQVCKGQWEANPDRFPNGMKWVAEQIHARGMTAGIWSAPFTVSKKSRLAAEHPEWLVRPNLIGSAIMDDDDLILDVTIPEAYTYLRDTYRTITQEWGFDALMEADYVYQLLMAETYHDATMTRIEVFRRGMQAIREGAGEDTFIMSFTPQPVTACFADGMRLGNDCAPIWRKDPNKWPWGCVETLRNAARRYYFAPYVWAPDQDCVFFDDAKTRERWGVEASPVLTRAQSIAWLTGAALTGGVVKIGEPYSALDADELDILKKILPVPEFPARPVDLFESDVPRIWSLPLKTAIGEWQVVAVFNWNENEAESVPLSFDSLGLPSNRYYAVYDFWGEKYFGNATGNLNVTVAPGSVLLLCLRPYEERPMFLSTNAHISQGATDFTALNWDAASKTLAGSFKGIEQTDYAIRVLVPESYTLANATASCGGVTVEKQGKVAVLRFHCPVTGEIQWSSTF